VLIQIERPVRVTLCDAEVKMLKTGEIYQVSPVIGRVLVADGWARAVGDAEPAGAKSVIAAPDLNTGALNG
jgi:hypothetical protein